MIFRRWFALPLLATLPMLPPMQAQRVSVDGGDQTFSYLSNQYFQDIYFKFSPTAGTSAGLHQYDSQLEDYSAAGVERQVAALQAFEKKLEAMDPNSLDAEPAADYQILLNNIRGQLLSLQVVRGWEKNPDQYSSGVTNSIFVIMERPYAPLDVRLQAVVARERQIPQALAYARQNLKDPPQIYTQIAIEQIDGDISFFQHDVPTAFAAANNPANKAGFADFVSSNAAVIEALQSYAQWMKTDLLPRSHGDFRWGADTFSKALEYNEMVDIPLPRLLQIAYADLHKNQAEFARIAKEIDPSKTAQQELAELATMHPAPNQLLQAFHDRFDSEIGFIRSHHIITLPSDVQPVLEETPPFMRATTQASMDPPGPFEVNSNKAYFNVTLPEPSWSPRQTAEYMAAFNIGTIVSTSVHEAYPGHYVQFLWQSQFPSTIRKVLGANTNIEGWAHYCEQMMLDQGYGQPGTGAADERQAKLIRLGQLQDALLRDARFVVAIRMHTGVGGWLTVPQAEQFFVQQGYQSQPIAEVETKRGSSDALYLYYTLGKLEIMKLRADVQKQQGAAFNLQKFHDALMHQGFAPIKIIRQAMLHNDSPVL
ncbi:MAG: DUF885 domain-containing protein [Acidobacteriota bacterium]